MAWRPNRVRPDNPEGRYKILAGVCIRLLFYILGERVAKFVIFKFLYQFLVAPGPDRLTGADKAMIRSMLDLETAEVNQMEATFQTNHAARFSHANAGRRVFDEVAPHQALVYGLGQNLPILPVHAQATIRRTSHHFVEAAWNCLPHSDALHNTIEPRDEATAVAIGGVILAREDIFERSTEWDRIDAESLAGVWVVGP